MNKSLLTTLLFLCLTGISFSQTRFLNPTGSDLDNNCLEVGNPCATINHAVSEAITGDTIVLQSGTYAFNSTQLINKSVFLKGDSSTNKPIITSTASDIIAVADTSVSIKGIVIHMGLTVTNGFRGIVANGNYNNLMIDSVEIYSIKPYSTGIVFGAFGINVTGGNGNLIKVSNSIIAPLDNVRDGHGRGIGLGSSNVNAPGGIIESNSITAFYPIQTSSTTAELNIVSNTLTGNTLIAYPISSSVNITNNTFDALNDFIASNLASLLEIRSIDNNSNANISNNSFLNYKNIALFSSASKNVFVTNNTFTPLPTADQYISIYANTKLQTSGVQNSTFSNKISIKGNDFLPALVNQGTAIMFANHYGQTSPAFEDTITIGGISDEDKNNFSPLIGRYIQLDSLSGPSNNLQFWATYSVTDMIPFSQNVVAYTWFNNYNIADLDSIESKMIDSSDVSGLGDVIIFDPILTSLKNNTSNQIEVFPNPANDFIYLNTGNFAGIAQLDIFDLVGRNIITMQVTNPTSPVIIPINQLSSGSYFISLTKDNERNIIKFIKE
jgi:hypothetical protein